MEIFKVKLGLSDLTATAMVEKGRNHVISLTGNASYTLPATTLPAITAACDALEAANLKVLDNGGRSDTLIRNERMEDLRVLLVELGGYVQAQSGGDREIIASAGFEVVLRGGPVGIPTAPTDMRAIPGELPGTAKLRWDRVRDRIFYQLWMTSGDPTLVDGWVLIAQTTKNFFTMDGLSTDKKYSFRANAVTTAGAGPVSDHATAKAA